jgi:hypothetical protein
LLTSLVGGFLFILNWGDCPVEKFGTIFLRYPREKNSWQDFIDRGAGALLRVH